MTTHVEHQDSTGALITGEPQVFLLETLSSRLQRLCGYAEAVRGGDVDAIHDMRVASRRLRAALRACGRFLHEGHAVEINEEVREVTRLLGRPRELDVMLGMLREEAGRATGPWRDALEAAAEAIRQARTAVDDNCAAAAAAAERLERWQPDDLLASTPVPVALAEWMASERSAARRKLRKAHRKWQHTDDGDHLHAVRVAYKRLRYICELFLPLDPLLEQSLLTMKAVQQALGDWNDYRMLLLELEKLDLAELNADGVRLMKRCLKHRADEHLCAFRMQDHLVWKQI